MGQFETDNYGNMLIVRKSVVMNGVGRSPREVLVDAMQRRVNKRGYLVDDIGNVVSKFGEKVVAKEDLDPMTEDIPPPLFQALFIPMQTVGSRNDASNYRRRYNTSRREPDGGSFKFSSSSGNALSGNTNRAPQASKRIQSDGESAHVEFDQGSIKKRKKKGKKGLRPLTGKSVAKKRVRRMQ